MVIQQTAKTNSQDEAIVTWLMVSCHPSACLFCSRLKVHNSLLAQPVPCKPQEVGNGWWLSNDMNNE